MSAIKVCLLSISMLFILSACSKDTYEPISAEISLAVIVNIKDMSVSFVDVEKRELVSVWDLEKPYTGGVIFPNGDTLLLYGKEMDTADLFSLESGEKVAEWNTGKGIVNAKLINDQKEIALINQGESQVQFYSMEGKSIAVEETGLSPVSIEEWEAEGELFVLSFNNEKLTRIDLQTKKTIDSFDIHGAASGALMVDEANQLWLGGHGEGAQVERDIHVYDVHSGQLVKKIPAPIMPVNFLIYEDSIFVLSHGSSQLYKMDLNGNVMDTVRVGANPFELAITSDHDLIVAGYDSNELYFINPETLIEEQKINIGNGPFEIVLRENMK